MMTSRDWRMPARKNPRKKFNVGEKRIILITGPTASGKTALALRVATRFGTSIISADSRQCFREMNIGVAKPSAAELQSVPHYFINSHSIHDHVTASIFADYAHQAAKEIFAGNDTAIMAGGTGLYSKAFIEGLDDIPPISPDIREQIAAAFAQHGLPWLQQQVQQQDPRYYANGEVQNPRRLMRALEVKQATGRSIREFQRQQGAPAPYRIFKYGIAIDRKKLYEQINNRVLQMMSQGLLDEVKGLHPYRHLNALQTVGYTELFDHLEGKQSLQQAIAQIQSNTRHYARRQVTWFKKDPEIRWVNSANEILESV